MKKNKMLLRKIPKWIKNRYFLSGFIFIIWMTFFDTSSILVKHRKSEEIKKLKKDIEYYKQEIKKDQKVIDILSSDTLTPELEKYLREELFLSKKNEEIFIVN
tara:strand:- start:1408 stop:1716 length:309 start_codon:yes stop_codon:yes gene_type:complete